MTFPSVTAYFVELLFAVFLIVTVRTVAGRWLGPGVKRLLWGLLILKALVPLTVATEHHPLGALAKLDVWVSPTATPAEPELARPADGGNSTPAMFPREFVPPGEFALPGDPAQLATIQSTEVEQPAAAAAPVTDAESPGFAATVTTSVVTTLPAVWLLGAVALFGLAVWRSRTVIRATTQDPVAVPDWVRTIFLDCREQIGLRTMPGLIVSPYIPSPCLVGVLRPRVLIPELLVEQRTPEAEQHIRHLLLHELTHLKQGDVWLTWLWTLTLAVQWFNPLFWLLNRHFRFDCETACDARVLTLLNDHERTDYGTSLLHVLIDTTPSRSLPNGTTRFTPPRFAPGFLGLAEPRSNIERRLTMMKSHRSPSWVRRLSATVVLLLLATLCLTSYGQSKLSTSAPADDAAKTDATKAGKAEAVWSEAVDGLRGRVVMSRDHVSNGTAILATKLELCNDGDQTLAFSWFRSRTKYVVADTKGNKVPEPQAMVFGGPGTFDSHVVIGPGETVVVDMTSQGMGVGADLAAILCLGVMDACWEFPTADTDYFLTATFTIPRQNKEGEEVKAWRGEKPSPAGSVAWYGQLNLPRVQIPLKPDPLPPNVGELIEQLGAEMTESPDGGFRYGAAAAMSRIDDERVIPWYVKLAALKNPSAKYAALDRLSRFDTDEALEGIKSCMNTRAEDLGDPERDSWVRDSANATRVAAAYALDRCRHPQARALLWTMRNDSYSSIRLFVLQRFEQTLDEPAAKEMDDLIESLINDPNEVVRSEAKRIQELRKNKQVAE